MRLGWSDWRLIGNNAFGQLTVTIESMSSRVSRVKPSVRTARAAGEGAAADLDLSTTQALFLDGHGTFGPGPFRGTAHSAPGSRRTSRGC